MELTVRLTIDDLPNDFDHFVRSLAMQISRHLSEGLAPAVSEEVVKTLDQRRVQNQQKPA